MSLKRIMARYYFNVRHGNRVFEDKLGGEFDGLPAAWQWAVQDAQEIMDLDLLVGLAEDQWIEIGDETGAVVASLPIVRAGSTLH